MLTQSGAFELAQKMRDREISSVEVTSAFLQRIEERTEKLNTFITVDAEAAMEQARQADEQIASGNAGPLTGVPIAVKDNISTRDLRTTCGSMILENYVPPFDATVVELLRAQGMPILGKTNLDEFAMGTSTENSAFGPTRNPWDVDRSPGGSSGGSAAAVADGQAPLALGSDTGGSIRQPASLCGVVGFKPTYGRCSRFGLVAFASSLDQIGPFARNVTDAALLAEVISGHDPCDSTSLPSAKISSKDVRSGSLKGMKIGIPRELFGGSIHRDVLEKTASAMDMLRSEGVDFREVSIPAIDLGVTTYYVIAPAEASSNLARFDGIRFGPRIEGDGHVGSVAATRGKLFGHEVKARIMMGTYALSAGYYDAYYVRAQKLRGEMTQAFSKLFQDVQVVLSPTSPVTAFKLGELTGDPLALKVLDLCTIPANMGGFPAISLCCGFAQGLPVGLQLMGAAMDDENLLKTAYQVEQLLGIETGTSGSA